MIPCRADPASGRARPIPSRCPSCCPSRTRRTTRATPQPSGRPKGWMSCATQLRARLDGELHVREHLLQAARAYVRQHGPNIDQAALVAALEAVACEHRSRAEVAGYGVDAWSITSSGRSAPQPGSRSAGRRATRGWRPTSARKAPACFAELQRSGISCAAGSAASTSMRSPAARSPRDAPPRSQPKGWPRWRRSTSTRPPPRRRPRSGGARPRSRAGSSARCSPKLRPRPAAEAGRARPGHRRARHRQEPDQRRADRRATRRRSSIWWLVPTLEKADEQAAEYTAPAQHRQPAGPRRARPRRARSPHRTTTPCAPGMRWSTAPRPWASTFRRRSATTAARSGSPAAFSARPRRCATIRPACSSWRRLPVAAMPGAAPRLRDRRRERDRQGHRDHQFDPSRIVDDDYGPSRRSRRGHGLRGTALLVRAAVIEHPGRELAFLRDRRHRRALKECADHLRQQGGSKARGQRRHDRQGNRRHPRRRRGARNPEGVALFRQSPPRVCRSRATGSTPSGSTRPHGHGRRRARAPTACVRQLRARPCASARRSPSCASTAPARSPSTGKIFGDHMTAERFAVPRDAEVYQVTSKTFSRQSITGTDRHGNRAAPRMAEAAACARRCSTS